MAIKILLIGARLSKNLGGPSLLPTTMHVLNRCFDHPDYTFISPTADDLPLAEEYNIIIIANPVWKEILIAALLKVALKLQWGTTTTRQVIQAFQEADIVLDIWGIGFSDKLEQDSFKTRLFRGIHFVTGKLFCKTVVKYTASLGPFETRWNRFFSKIYLQYFVDLILARDETTQRRLKDLGVKTLVQVCPDTAFLLQTQPTPLAEELAYQKLEHPIIGFSISHMASSQSGDSADYIMIMAKLADYAIESTNAQLVLIPNELSHDIEHDDRYYVKETWKRMQNQIKAMILTDEYSAPELKGIIGQCDVVIAARYHTIIASLSQGIPVLATAWHTKYTDVLSLFGQEGYACPVDSLDIKFLKEQFDSVWYSRHRISQEINARLPAIREDILAGGNAISLLYNKRPR
ncbi:MAG TPA: polysaccharide pyruvyl transferase family protein [Chloroflexi bacterium]|nr:polysaccharide pyruvyl transferase family protein [Chloroflexota bacterium]